VARRPCRNWAATPEGEGGECPMPGDAGHTDAGEIDQRALDPYCEGQKRREGRDTNS